MVLPAPSRSDVADDLRAQVHEAARRARTAARALATLSTETKNHALRTAADYVLMNTRTILEAIIHRRTITFWILRELPRELVSHRGDGAADVHDACTGLACARPSDSERAAAT